MTRKKLITVAALAVLAFACSETVGGVMQDAGGMLADAGEVIRDAGDAMQDAGDVMQPDAGAQDVSASCNKGEGNSRWAEFPISNPGQTEVTICSGPHPTLDQPPYNRRVCSRLAPAWYEGTNTGIVWSCDDTTTITVHN